MTEVNDDWFVFSFREAKVGELTTFQKLSILFFQVYTFSISGMSPTTCQVPSGNLTSDTKVVKRRSFP